MQKVFIEGGFIRKLWDVETDAYRDHLLRLDLESRRNGFSGSIADGCSSVPVPPGAASRVWLWLILSCPDGGFRTFPRACFRDLRLMRPGSRHRSIADFVIGLAGGRIVLEMFIQDFVLPVHFSPRQKLSRFALAAMPFMVVARNLGHVDLRMVQEHYGHLASDFVADAIRAHAPTFGLSFHS